MNENFDLIKILKNCPKGWKFWSPLYDEVEFCHICRPGNGIIIRIKTGTLKLINFDATITLYYIKSSIPALYPSKDQQDWSKFTAPWYKKEKFDPKTLQPFDRVLVRDEHHKRWSCSFFSHIVDSFYYPYIAIDSSYKFCIPYNDDTKHLVGTTEEAPEFYRYWDD